MAVETKNRKSNCRSKERYFSGIGRSHSEMEVDTGAESKMDWNNISTQTASSMVDFSLQTENSLADCYTQTEEQTNDYNYCLESPNTIAGESNNPDIFNCGFIEEEIESTNFIDDQAENEILNTAFYEEVASLNFDSFCTELKRCIVPGFQFEKKLSKIVLYQTYSESVVTVKLVVTVNEDFTCQLTVHGKEVPRSHEIWDGLPMYFHEIHYVKELCLRINKYSVCSGNPDKDFTALIPIGAGLTNNLQQTTAYHEGDFNAMSKSNLLYHGTIRTINCSLLVFNTRCKHCAEYRRYLKKRKARIEDRDGSKRAFNHINFKHKDMTRKNLITKLSEQKSEINVLQRKVWKLRREMKTLIAKDGVSLQPYENIDFKTLMNTCDADFERSFPDSNCRQRIFWEQQKLMASKSDSRGMRWHPMVIKWCLQIIQKSAQAYDMLRESGFISLPSSRTLFNYSHYLKSALGLQKNLIECAKKEAEKQDLYKEEWRSYVGLLFDEIKIREDLVYDKHSGELIGYCNLDSIANEMMDLENAVNRRGKNVAKFVLVVMLRSTASKWCFPLCGFATRSITADFLYPVIWRTVPVVEKHLKLKVLFFTCDGATPNRRFFGMHRADADELVFKTVNPHDLSRNIYFISDVPHLLKTSRNNLSNSYSHKKSRMLWKNGKDISSGHIVRLFEENCELNMYNPCPKLTRERIDLVSFNYMKVNLAAQVLSHSVALALEELYGAEVSETVTFIRHMNKFFDILNVRSLFEGRNKRNGDLNVFRTVDDVRLKYLTEDFIGYLNEWKEEVNNRQGNLNASQKATMMLSYQTINGLKMSIKSISNCVNYLLGKGASFVLTHTFNQDPLEQHFGHYRHRGGGNSNPSVYEVQNIMTTLRTVGGQALPTMRGNTQRAQLLNRNIDNSKLPKRKPMR